jgi:hypothetical protein
MPYARKKMIASNASWIEKNAPSRESFCILALLSMLIGAPAFLMIRLLEPELLLPAFSILLFSDTAILAIVARINSENVTLWDIAGAFTMVGCAAAIFSEPDQVATVFRATRHTTSGHAAVGDSHQAASLPAPGDVGLQLERPGFLICRTDCGTHRRTH